MFDVCRCKEVRAGVHTYSIQTGTGQSSAPLCCGYWPSLRRLYDRQPLRPSRSTFCSSPSNSSCLRREPSDWGRNWAALWLHMEIKTRKRHISSKKYIKKTLTSSFFFVFSIYVVVLADCWWSLYGKCNLVFCCRRCSPILRLFQCL